MSKEQVKLNTVNFEQSLIKPRENRKYKGG